MSQGQMTRPQGDGGGGQEQPRREQPAGWRQNQDQPIKYGDVLPVGGDLANKPVAPADAAMMQCAETAVFGQTLGGGVAAAMQAAATRNEQASFVDHRQATDIAADQGVTITDTAVPGAHIITERVAGQIVGQYIALSIDDVAEGGGGGGGGGGTDQSAITIGEALEAAAKSVGDKKVEQSDVAAIQEAEMRATGDSVTHPGGLAATAQSAANYNAVAGSEEDKIKLSSVLAGATAALPADKAADREDAERVTGAELRNNPGLTTQPGGVAAAVTAAARLNESTNQ